VPEETDRKRRIKAQSPPTKDEKEENLKDASEEVKAEAKERLRQGTGQSRRGRDSLQKVEDRLNEMFATIALGQQAIALASGDQRHAVGAHVTAELSPPLVHAWVNLGRENEAVRRVLIRMSEGTAWGEVVLASVGFAYSQAQAYGALPGELPNPWLQAPIVPASEEVQNAAAQNSQPPFTGRSPQDARSGVDVNEEAHNEAERQRKIVEERRKQRGS
jgi:hypothetical protein